MSSNVTVEQLNIYLLVSRYVTLHLLFLRFSR